MDDLQNELSGSIDGSSDVDESDLAESASKIVTKNTKELPSLFEALMTSSYKELLESVGGMQQHQMKRKKTVADYDVNMDEDDASDDDDKDVNMSSDDVEDEHDEDTVNKDDTDRGHGRRLRRRYRGGETEACACENVIDMDLVMAEAITKYTVLELFNTLKLETMTVDKKKKLIESLMH
jgi:hypothetical protein